jgi:two-component system, LytTR family, response regulator
VEAIEQPDHFFVYADYLQVKISIPQVTYLESMGDYVKIHLDNQPKPVITLERLKNLSAKLEPQGFKRIHRSFVINTEKITAKQKTQVKIGEKWLPVGEMYGF